MVHAMANEHEKIWEKPWTNADLKTFSTSWSLAGDSGLLLSLKQFSENMMSKSVAIEKKLQKLVNEEQQCNVKLNNALSSFLLLENSQFIENRVYEHETPVEKPDEAATQLKTKEEKEADLFNTMTEACQTGMSIMETYFDMLNTKDLKKTADQLVDDDDEYEEEDIAIADGNEDSKDLIIYEAKDPYVLRSLPYLIGSQAFLEHDHVGLKDLDSEEEDLEDDLDLVEENREDDLDSSTDGKDAQAMDRDDMFGSEDSEEEAKETKVSLPKKKTQAITFEESGGDSESGEDDLFMSPRKSKKKQSIFDDSRSDSEDGDEIGNLVSKVADGKQRQLETQVGEETEPEPEKPAAAAPLDFAAELAKKLANKNKPKQQQEDKLETESEDESNSKPGPTVTTVDSQVPNNEVKNVSNLFGDDEDDDSDSDNGNIFSSTVNDQVKQKPKKGLFDDSDESEREETKMKQQPEQDVEDKVTTEKPKKPTIASELNNLFAKNNKPTAKMALFDSEDDNEKDEKTYPESPADTLFKPTPATTKTSAEKQPAKKSQPAKVKSLFDTDDDEEDDFLPAIPKIEPKKEPTVVKPAAKKSSLFDSEEDDDDFPPAIPKTEQKKEPTVAKPVATTKSSLLFDSDSEETFKPVVPKIEPQKKEPTPVKTTATAAKLSLFDDDNDDEDDLFSPLEQKPKTAAAAVQVKAPASKKVSLFSDSSDADGDLFGKASATTEKSSEKLDKKQVKPSVKPNANKSLFDSTDSSPDEKKPQSQVQSTDAVARNNADVSRAKEPTTKKIESPKTKKPSPLFGSSTDSDTDLFQVTSSPSSKKPQTLSTHTEPKKTKTPLFEDSSDDLFKPSDSTQQQVDNPLMAGITLKSEKPPEEGKKSLFEEGSSDDLFQPKSESEKKSVNVAGNKNQMLGALANSHLFNKLRQKSESDDDFGGAEDKPEPVAALVQEATGVTKKSLLSESDEDAFGESEATKIIGQKTIVKKPQVKDEAKATSSRSKKPDLFGSDNEIFGVTSPVKVDEIKSASKKAASLFEDSSDESLFKVTESKTKGTVEKTKASIFDDSSEELFQVNEPKKTEKQSSNNMLKKKASIFEDSDKATDDLFKSTVENDDPNLAKVAAASETETTTTTTSSSSKVSSVKNIGKNLVFGAGALASSSLFKKLNDKKKAEESEDEEEKEVVVETTGSKSEVTTADSDPFAGFISDSFVSKPVTNEAVVDLIGDDIFGDIKTDKAFSESTLKNAQKDRIQVSGRKKRPPSNRRTTATAIDPKPNNPKATIEKVVEEDPLALSSDPFGFDVVTKKSIEIPISQQASETPKTITTTATTTKETGPKASIFDREDEDDLDIFKPKKKIENAKSKAASSLFDDDDTDIFADIPSLSANKAPTKAKVKAKEPKKKASLAAKNTDDIFGDLGADGDDIFDTKKKKKQPEKTTVDSDPLNLF